MSGQVMIADTKTQQPANSLMTGEELFALGDDGGRMELIKGSIVKLMPTGRPHSLIEGKIALYLGIYNLEHNFGEVHTGELGIFTRRNPDTVRGMDVAFISHKRLEEANDDGFLTVAPELIVEILSPSNSWFEVQQKLTEYFGVGAQMIWIVIPESEQIYVYRSLTELKILTKKDTLTCEDILPAFSVSVSEIFS